LIRTKNESKSVARKVESGVTKSAITKDVKQTQKIADLEKKIKELVKCKITSTSGICN